MKKGKRKSERLKKSSSLFWILQSLLILCILSALFLLLSDAKLPGWKEREQHILEEKVRSLQELVTVNQMFREVIYKEEKRFISDKRVLFSILFHIKAGVNLESAAVTWSSQGTPELIIDSPRILSIDADEKSIEQIFIKEQFAEIRQSDYMDVILQEKIRLEDEARERGILMEAEEQMIRILEQLFSLAGYEKVNIRLRGNG